jgi:hypothetical protein
MKLRVRSPESGGNGIKTVVAPRADKAGATSRQVEPSRPVAVGLRRTSAPLLPPGISRSGRMSCINECLRASRAPVPRPGRLAA